MELLVGEKVYDILEKSKVCEVLEVLREGDTVPAYRISSDWLDGYRFGWEIWPVDENHFWCTELNRLNKEHESNLPNPSGQIGRYLTQLNE